MNKLSQIKAMWPNIYQKLKNPPPGLNLGDFSRKLPPMNKIIFEASPPSGKGDALGYVTTEDADQNGKIDSLHIVIPNLEKHLQGITLNDLQGDDLNKLTEILSPFVEIIAHEMGHLKDYKKEQKESFPGGEGAAESAAQQAVSQISIKASKPINILNTNVFVRRNYMGKNILASLVGLANKLDSQGKYSLADELTEAIKKFAQDTGDTGEILPELPLSAKQSSAGEIQDQILGYAKDGEEIDKIRYLLQALEKGTLTPNRLAGEMSAQGISVAITPENISNLTELAKRYVASISELKRSEQELDRAMHPGTFQDQLTQTKLVSPTEPTVAPKVSVFKQFTGMNPGPKSENIFTIQSKLNELGYETGGVDGIWGPKSKEAWTKFLADFQDVVGRAGASKESMDFRLKVLKSGDLSKVLKYMDSAKNYPGFKARLEAINRDIAQKALERRMPKALERRMPKENLADDKKDDENCNDDKKNRAERLVSDASFNAVFWDKNIKTPFGR